MRWFTSQSLGRKSSFEYLPRCFEMWAAADVNLLSSLSAVALFPFRTSCSWTQTRDTASSSLPSTISRLCQPSICCYGILLKKRKETKKRKTERKQRGSSFAVCYFHLTLRIWIFLMILFLSFLLLFLSTCKNTSPERPKMWWDILLHRCAIWKKKTVFLRNENIDVITMLYSWLLNVSSVYSCWSPNEVYVLDKKPGADMKHNIVCAFAWLSVFVCSVPVCVIDLWFRSHLCVTVHCENPVDHQCVSEIFKIKDKKFNARKKPNCLFELSSICPDWINGIKKQLYY